MSAVAESAITADYQRRLWNPTLPEYLLWVNLSAVQMKLCVYLEWYARGEAVVWPTNKSLARMSRMSEQAICRRVIPSMVRAGLMCRVPAERPEQGRGEVKVSRGHLLVLMWGRNAQEYLASYPTASVLELNPELTEADLKHMLLASPAEPPTPSPQPGTPVTTALRLVELPDPPVTGNSPPPPVQQTRGCETTDKSRDKILNKQENCSEQIRSGNGNKTESQIESNRIGFFPGEARKETDTVSVPLPLAVAVAEPVPLAVAVAEPMPLAVAVAEPVPLAVAEPVPSAAPMAQAARLALPAPCKSLPPVEVRPADQPLTIEAAIERLPREPGLVGTVVSWMVEDLNDYNARNWHTQCANQVARGESPPVRLLAAYRAGLNAARSKTGKAGPTFSRAWKAWHPRAASGSPRGAESSAQRVQKGTGQTSPWSGQPGYLNERPRTAGVGTTPVPVSAPLPVTIPSPEPPQAHSHDQEPVDNPEEVARLWAELRAKLARDMAESKLSGRTEKIYYRRQDKSAARSTPATDAVPAIANSTGLQCSPCSG